MSTSLFVHVGQCGNQVGESFWQRAVEDYCGSNPGINNTSSGIRPTTAAGGASASLPPGACPLFHEDGKAACVLVDSESKVVNRLRSSLKGVIREQNVCLDANGRANNWAMGFSSSAKEMENGRGLFYSAVEAVRHEMERMDSLQTVVLFHSLAGGTGSGVGSALLQYLRDSCPSLNLVTCSVGPFASGECPTQWYNAAFSAQYLAELADVVIYRDNDANMTHYVKASSSLPSSSSSAGPLAQVTMNRLNDSLAADLASILFPYAGSASRASGILRPFDGAGLSRACCPFRYAKFVDVRSTWSLSLPGQQHHLGSTSSSRPPRPGGLQPEWSTVVKALTSSLPTRDLNDAPITTLTAQACLRGLSPSEIVATTASSSSSSSRVARGTEFCHRHLRERAV